MPYEESIAVPLIVRYDAILPSARRDSNLVTNVDFAPTFAQAAGATTPYGGYHTKRYVLIRYNGRDKELYDLRKDPWQRENQYESKALSDVRSSLNDRLVDACQPRTPGVVLDRD